MDDDSWCIWLLLTVVGRYGCETFGDGDGVCATFVASRSHVIARDHSSSTRLGYRVPCTMLAFGTAALLVDTLEPPDHEGMTGESSV